MIILVTIETYGNHYSNSCTNINRRVDRIYYFFNIYIYILHLNNFRETIFFLNIPKLNKFQLIKISAIKWCQCELQQVDIYMTVRASTSGERRGANREKVQKKRKRTENSCFAE